MSTSPSWFDQEKFSRLVKKKPGAKGPHPAVILASSAEAAPSKPDPDSTSLLTPPTPPIGRAPTGPLPPRAGTGTLPPISSRTSTGPLPPPRRATGGLPAVAPPSTASLPPPPVTKSGAFSPPLPEKRPSTGPLPPPRSLTRTTSSLPPPPSSLRATGQLPPPRAQTGKLPLPPVESPAPSSAHIEKSQNRPSVPLPDFKPLFGYDNPEQPAAVEPITQESASNWLKSNIPEPTDEPSPGFDPATESAESTDISSEEPPSTESEESQAEMETLRRHLESKTSEIPSPSGEEVSTAIRERDEARMEVIVLRHQLEAAEQTRRDTEAMASQLEELSHVIDERDSVRRDYATLREQFETLKLDRSHVESGEENEKLQEEINQLRQQLATRAPGKSATGSLPGGADVAALREELKKAKEEASVASRGLALSQKALQETRDALREASDGIPKGGLEDLKKEQATLVRQNTLLQGQNDQLTRELSATKAKLAAKGG